MHHYNTIDVRNVYAFVSGNTITKERLLRLSFYTVIAQGHTCISVHRNIIVESVRPLESSGYMQQGECKQHS